MGLQRPSRFRLIEVGLALLVCLVAGVFLSDFSQLYPAWPAIAGVPVNPELLVPGLLGIVALVGVVRNGITVGSIAVGVLSIITVSLAVTSLHSLYADTNTGGLFGGSLLVLFVGIPLAIAVLVQNLAREMGVNGVSYRVRNRFDGT